jgi:hypothetical protein
MKSVQIVGPEHIHAVWEIVCPMLNVAFINYENPDCGIDNLKADVINGKQTLFVVMENNKITGAFTVEINNYPNYKIAHTTCMGGKGLFNENTVKQYEEWCKGNGITKIRAYAQDSQARLFKLKMGLEKVTNVVEKNL